MAEDTPYAPKSPDLSSFFSAAPAPPTPPQHNLQHNQQHLDLNKLQTPGPVPPVYEYSSPSSRAYQPHQSTSTPVHIKQEQPHYPPSAAIKSEYSSYQPPLQTHHHHQHHHQPHQQYLSPQYHQPPPPQLQQQQQQQHLSPQQPPLSPYGHQPVKYQDQSNQQYLPQTPQSQPHFDIKQYAGTPALYDIPYNPNPDAQHLPQTPGSVTMPPRKNTQSAPSPPPIDPSPVRTKFPTARIKRIMQADEEVGKVAQQTPIAVGKALELFMIAVVSKSAEIAKEKNSKRVTAQMLKQVIETDGQYDFLADIAAKVGDEEKRGGRSKADTESDEEMEVETKKKGKGGRKKKAA
ncbi:histone-like transcription factor and archaeal histone [Colletotrichum truncatum]|uniref:Histone-like transcription factor and archaeal histone n=1 Tax=Colletotrichum truncatum TaxID=5467 RepID=A0ACC3YHU4_COLTU|nr:histone-like transcription factor and archaeal histone [Colletotrichum truncatum]KAF6785459.1 histone-like transcription factor and archaeal histone [Colletotrichum truncatum]